MVVGGSARALSVSRNGCVISNVVAVINSRSADFIVGKSAGAHALGLFSVSYELANLPTTELIAPINRAVFPGYALKAKDSNALKQGFLSVIGIIAAFAIPAGVGVAATADVLVPLIFGPQWLETVPLISILAIHGIIVALQTNCYYIYLALGKPYIATWLGVAQITILLPILTILTMRYGGIGAAYAYLASQLVIIPFTFMSILRLLGITVRQMLLVLWRPVVSAAIMFGIVRLVTHMLISEPFDNLTGMIHLDEDGINRNSRLRELSLCPVGDVGATGWSREPFLGLYPIHHALVKVQENVSIDPITIIY